MNNQTYKMMSKVAEQIEEDNEDKLVEMYKEGEEGKKSQVLAKLFVLNYGLINKNSNKYMSIEQDIAESIALESLEKAIKDYSSSGKSKLSSYFILIYKRDLVNEYKKVKADKRQLNEDSASVDVLTNGENGNFGVTYENNHMFYEDEVDIDFYELDFLTDNEKKILSEYKKCGFKANQKDIAERLNVNKSSISRAINRLSDKLPQLKEELFS